MTGRTLADLQDELQRRWDELGATSGGSVRVTDLPTRLDAGALLAGVGADGVRILLPLAANRHRGFKEDRKSEAVQVRLLPLERAGTRRYFADLVCLRGELKWLFTTLASDVVLRLEAEPAADPVAVLSACMTGWRRLLAGGGRPLTAKQQAGLFAELVVLAALSDRSRTALEAWRGPTRHHHDFVRGHQAVEVKGTLATDDRTVWIHGIDQLDAPAQGSLHLAHIRLRQAENVGESLPELIGRISELVPAARFRGLLGAAGYVEDHAEGHYQSRYEVVEQHWYEVDDGFPRLTRRSFPDGAIPPGLSDFNYALNLGVITRPVVGKPEVEQVLDGLAL